METHVQQRVGATLFILLGAPVCDESHVLVEPDRLRVLLIHSEFADVVMGDAVFEQLLADAVFTMIGIDEQHFEPSVGDSHERKGRLVRAVAVGAHDDQFRYFGDGLRRVLLDAVDLIIGQKRMVCYHWRYHSAVFGKAKGSEPLVFQRSGASVAGASGGT